MWIVSLNPDPIEPGESGEMEFGLLSWAALRPRLYVGLEFVVREGSHVIAHAVIKSIED